MNHLFKKAVALSVLTSCLSAASAATYDYTFQRNVLDPNYSINHIDTIATAQLSSPFANMSVSDEDGGIRLSYSSLGALDGKISVLSFNYIPTLGSLEQVWPNVPPTAGGTYFYADSDTPIPYLFVTGWGTRYSSEDVSVVPFGPFSIATPDSNATPASFVIALDVTTSRSDNFTLHFRGLPADITAATLVPQYVEAINTSFGKMATAGQAVILSSAVPEMSMLSQLAVGLSALAWVARRRKQG